METGARRGRKLPRVLFVVVLALICLSIVFALTQKSPWIVPQDAKKLTNPLRPTPELLNSAKAIFGENCVECHGESGKGDGPDAMMYDPAPADLTDAGRMAKKTDGELFYQITEGKKPMPAFKNKMTVEQRWALVLLVRSFAASAAAPQKEVGTPSGKPPVTH